ncbi:MAG: AAA family ATPase [Candidatus Dormibacteraeota bacterium]|uniref:AAA family ATPase n=1 Tax=Candidatus Amunia macphersoniae TaxID=3127014 RepID=A0A934KLW8_9BACT|nr:AAA family ATPase [Candidatus Dormibacteraeota bacterium]
MLPARVSALRRAGLVVGSVIAPPRSVDTASGDLDGTRLSPSALTRRRGASVSERMRNAWRQSGYLARLDAAIAAPRLRRCAVIAVMSPKGGVGKTTVSSLLGALFALVRVDRVVAIDSNPDYGSLGRSLTPEHNIFVDNLLESLDDPAPSVTALDLQLGRGPHGLMVLPAPTDPLRMAALGEQHYTRVIQRLQGLVGIIILDCGTGLQEPPARAALEAADQIVLVSDAEPATASLVAEASQSLRQAGKPLHLVVNKMGSRGSRLELKALEGHVPDAASLVVLPAERQAATRLAAGSFDWREGPSAWRRSVAELAVALVADWKDVELSE